MENYEWKIKNFGIHDLRICESRFVLLLCVISETCATCALGIGIHVFPTGLYEKTKPILKGVKRTQNQL